LFKEIKTGINPQAETGYLVSALYLESIQGTVRVSTKGKEFREIKVHFLSCCHTLLLVIVKIEFRSQKSGVRI